MKKLQRQHKQYLFYGLLVVGIGFCVAGVFVPALLPVGSACIVGAVAIGQNLTQQPEYEPQMVDLDRHNAIPAEIAPHIPQSDDSLEVDLHIGRHLHYSHRVPHAYIEPDESADVDDHHDAKAGPNKRIHRQHP